MGKTIKLNFEDLSLKDDLEFITLEDVLKKSVDGFCCLTSRGYGSLAIFLDEKMTNPIKQMAVALIKCLKHTSAGLLLYDLKGCDPVFGLNAPPTIPLFHLEQALKAIYENPDNLEKCPCVGFRRVEIEVLLGVSLITEEQRRRITNIDKALQQEVREALNQNNIGEFGEYDIHQLQKEIKELKTQNEHWQKLTTILCEELTRTGKKFTWGGRSNLSALARLTENSILNQNLFKAPLGYETARKKLEELNLH
ncbi:hypothetical protein A4G19_04280 [Pasteurellaceae bacterium Macca]|nr:hypothetical protein [Pasteurellaceae bacterium Macca]